MGTDQQPDLMALNEVSVLGLQLRSLEPFVGDERIFVSFSDLQAALALDKRSTEKAIKVLVRIGYLIHKPVKPPRYALTTQACRLLTERTYRAVNRSEGLEVLLQLLQRNGWWAEDTKDCWISAIGVTGSILDTTVVSHLCIDANITVNVTAGETAVFGMRKFEKAMIRADRCLKINLIFNLL